MTPSASGDVVRICQELIRIDTSNYGDNTGPGERAAADYVVALLREVGLEPQVFESAPGRTTVVQRLRGTSKRPGLCIHGHLDVVPAEAADWSVDPFGGVIKDDCVWGRGAVDMKDMVAMMLTVLRGFVREGIEPERDLLFVFFADEEAGGDYGSHFMVKNHPEVFEGISEAISEVGGYSVTVDTTHGQRRVYLLQTAEKGISWLRLTARGTAGHGSIPQPDNAIVHLAEAVSRIAAHPWPVEIIPCVDELLAGVAELTGATWPGTSADAADVDALAAQLRGARGFIRATVQDTANVTMLSAGYKHNVVPQSAEARVDCRFLPGHQDSLVAIIRDLAGPHVQVEVDHHDIAIEAPTSGSLVDAMTAAVKAEDPDAVVLPYCLSGGTDNKSLSLLGITGYGFAPLRLPADLDFAPMFHGVDERVPIDALHFGVSVLRTLLLTC